MGIEVTIRCRLCDYSKNVLLGSGMRYGSRNLTGFSSPHNILPSLIKSKKIFKSIQDLVEKHGAQLRDNYGHSIYQCHKCKELYGRFFLYLDYPGGNFKPEYQCAKCMTPLTELLTGEDAEKASNIRKVLLQCECPKCNERSLTEGLDPFIFWD